MFDDLEKKKLQEDNKKKDEENQRLRQELEVAQQKNAVYADAARETAKKTPQQVVREKKEWKDLQPHGGDRNDLRYAKTFLNKMKPTGKTIEVIVDDKDWKGEPNTHSRRSLALRGGILVSGARFEVYVQEHQEMNLFECILPDARKVVLALKESVTTKSKYSFGTAFYFDRTKWTREFEQDEQLHGVPADASQNVDLTPEQLVEYHHQMVKFL